MNPMSMTTNASPKANAGQSALDKPGVKLPTASDKANKANKANKADKMPPAKPETPAQDAASDSNVAPAWTQVLAQVIHAQPAPPVGASAPSMAPDANLVPATAAKAGTATSHSLLPGTPTLTGMMLGASVAQGDTRALPPNVKASDANAPSVPASADGKASAANRAAVLSSGNAMRDALTDAPASVPRAQAVAAAQGQTQADGNRAGSGTSDGNAQPNAALIAATELSAPGPRNAAQVMPTDGVAKWGPQLMNSLGERVSVQMRNGVEHAVIRLDPPMMGSLQITIRHEAGVLQVHMTASNEDVARQLQAASDAMRNELSAKHNDVTVSVRHGQPSSQGGDAQGQHSQREARDDHKQPGRALAEATTPEDDTAFRLRDTLTG